MTTESRRDIFQAIADPTRRKIIELLSEQPMNLRTIAEHFEISRPAISQQIKILDECQVIETRREGRETFCSIRPGELKKIADWAERYKGLWEERIDAFENYVNQLQSRKNKHHGKSK
ncbi:MAG TPA: metalloregulator ArsR/SmtB family transcription factor [Cyclobacteriaceae bacterium]|nr:metalloregulator ArsR/SmtB family transcription factor [Cyclobacteriaceae bacterium]